MAWLSIVKAALPYVTQIAAATIPAFSSKPDVSKVDPLVSQQIEELQSVATKNAEAIHVLAEKLQQTMQGIDEGATNLQRELAKLKLFLFITSLLAIFSFALTIWVLAR